MGALRRIPYLPRGRRVLAGAVLAVGAVGGAVACDPGGLSTASAAYTTDRTATDELNRRHASVRWLTCTGDYGGGRTYTPGKPTPSASETTVVTVDCRGETKDGRRITVTGRVTRAVDGACVRGDLTAKVGGKVWFHVNGLGDCDATTGPTYRPPVTYRPTHGQPGPVVTATVTRTIWCPDDPVCRPVQGK
ncbi:hypothetical protein [Streptomyces kebangsaanensis]|uniref:hypothetical protein n=1 Tax=Streptomyces kebangsaanensis TaxID=864058 RepID=UPI000A61EBD3|nr:hypothetical protein [Streptomyces kebangsaanensis]